MNQDRFFGIWKQIRGAVKEHWGELTCDAVAVASGKLDSRTGRIQARRGLARQESDRALAEFVRRNRNWRNPVGGGGEPGQINSQAGPRSGPAAANGGRLLQINRARDSSG